MERSCPVFNGKCVADGEAARYFTSGDGGASLYKKWIAQPVWSENRIAEWGHAEFIFRALTQPDESARAQALARVRSRSCARRADS